MYPELLRDAGINIKQAGRVRQAYLQGLGVEEAARRVTSSMLDRAGFIIAGTPEECLRAIEPLLPYLKKQNFDQLVIGVPLGPSPAEAIPLIAREVLPVMVAALK